MSSNVKTIRKVMREYIEHYGGSDDIDRSFAPMIRKTAPHAPASSTEWAVNTGPAGQSLQKRFDFYDHSLMLVFIEHVVAFENSIEKYAELSIKKNSVTVTVNTPGSKTMTADDQQYAAQLNQIARDVENNKASISAKSEIVYNVG